MYIHCELMYIHTILMYIEWILIYTHYILMYENNILIYDPKLTQTVCQRQREYLEQSNAITLESVDNWSVCKRLWNNSMAVLGPLL